MLQENKKSRIEYIDLMKGICISLVVIVHCDITLPVNIVNDLLQNLRMPLYFFLSGLFFKEYGSFMKFLVKKANKLIIPYFFFSYIPYFLFDFFFTTDVNKSFYYYLFMGIEPYNFPLWFLRSLFVAYILFYAIHKMAKNRNWIIILLVLLIISFFAWLASSHIPKYSWHFIWENFLTSIFALPFLYIASLLRSKGLLSHCFNTKQLVYLLCSGLIAWVICVQKDVFFIKAHFGEIYPLLYISAFGGITCIWVFCYKIKKLYYFSYVGRYSIIVLGTFAPVNRFLYTCFGLTGYAQACITLAFMPIMVYLFKRFFPHFTAQKDLITIHKR